MRTRFLATQDVARRLRCSAETVRLLERTGRLPAERLECGQRIFRLEDVERLQRERERTAEPAMARER